MAFSRICIEFATIAQNALKRPRAWLIIEIFALIWSDFPASISTVWQQMMPYEAIHSLSLRERFLVISWGIIWSMIWLFKIADKPTKYLHMSKMSRAR